MKAFITRANEMGLDISKAYKGMFSYEDSFGKVVYRQLFTKSEPGNPDETDNVEFPYLAVYTKQPDQEKYIYAGYVSYLYKFVGNENLINPIRQSIRATGKPILREVSIFSEDRARLRHEMLIQSSVASPEVGDVVPVMIVSNSYNGTRAATMSFGIATTGKYGFMTFAFNLGEMRMVHIASSRTTMTTAVSEYVEVFSESILDLIQHSLNKKLSEEEMLSTLDLIEGIGKRRREIISKSLPETVTGWGMFLSIVKYSSFEANLNIKRMLENIAQSVLVIPAKMFDVLKKLEDK
jgi:hypothetical protein